MSPSANVQSVQALNDLKVALGRFAGDTRDALQTSEQEIRRTLDWLQERLNHWQGEVRRTQEEARRVQTVLARCQASGYTDKNGNYHAPDCRIYEQELRESQRRLRETEAELRNAQQWARQVQQAVTEYQVQARRLQELATSQTPKAQAYLERAISDLQHYQAVASGMAAMGLGMIFVNAVKMQYKSDRNKVGSYAVRQAKAQEIELVQFAGRGTRNWKSGELKTLHGGKFPKGYQGHHINNFARFPDLGGAANNIRFVTKQEHKALHQGNWRNNSSGKMFNRKSLLVQWIK